MLRCLRSSHQPGRTTTDCTGSQLHYVTRPVDSYYGGGAAGNTEHYALPTSTPFKNHPTQPTLNHITSKNNPRSPHWANKFLIKQSEMQKFPPSSPWPPFELRHNPLMTKVGLNPRRGAIGRRPSVSRSFTLRLTFPSLPAYCITVWHNSGAYGAVCTNISYGEFHFTLTLAVKKRRRTVPEYMC